MSSQADGIKAFLRGIARVQRSFHIEVGPIRASGIPAVMIGIAGIVLARGVATVLSENATRLPETLGAARGLAEAMNGSPRLRS
ncbi:MAG TPA: hypothetical protein VGF18_01345 [Candidatus Tumulicola sp.]|jgi:hypothetical protein